MGSGIFSQLKSRDKAFKICVTIITYFGQNGSRRLSTSHRHYFSKMAGKDNKSCDSKHGQGVMNKNRDGK